MTGKHKTDYTALNNLWCELKTVVFRSNSREATYIRLKEIKKRKVLCGNQTGELLTNSIGKRLVALLNPS